MRRATRARRVLDWARRKQLRRQLEHRGGEEYHWRVKRASVSENAEEQLLGGLAALKGFAKWGVFERNGKDIRRD